MLVTFINRSSDPISLALTALADGTTSVLGPIQPDGEAARQWNPAAEGDVYTPQIQVISPGSWRVEVKRDGDAAQFLRATEGRPGGSGGFGLLNEPDSSVVLTGGSWIHGIGLEVGSEAWPVPGGTQAPVPEPGCELDPPEQRFPVDLDGDGKRDFDIDIQDRRDKETKPRKRADRDNPSAPTERQDPSTLPGADTKVDLLTTDNAGPLTPKQPE